MPSIDIKKAIEYFEGYGSPYDDLVIKSLHKQLPKKHLLKLCPICNSDLINWDELPDGVFNYCPNCGQKIKYHNIE